MSDGRGGGRGRRPSHGGDGTQSLQVLNLDIYKINLDRLYNVSYISVNVVHNCLFHIPEKTKQDIISQFLILYTFQMKTRTPL